LKRSIVIGLLLVFSLLMTACSKPESVLIGKWVGTTGSFQFSKDKTGVINPPQGVALPQNVPFKWSVQGSDTVRMDVSAPVGKTYFGKLENKNVLIIEDDKFVKQK
jgi:hypothetical protein